MIEKSRVPSSAAVGRASTFLHYAHNTERPLNFTFYEDSLQYESVRDGVLASRRSSSRGCAMQRSIIRRLKHSRERARTSLTLIDGDHQLIASLPRIWDETAAFSEAHRGGRYWGG